MAIDTTKPLPAAVWHITRERIASGKGIQSLKPKVLADCCLVGQPPHMLYDSRGNLYFSADCYIDLDEAKTAASIMVREAIAHEKSRHAAKMIRLTEVQREIRQS